MSVANDVRRPVVAAVANQVSYARPVTESGRTLHFIKRGHAGVDFLEKFTQNEDRNLPTHFESENVRY